MKKRLLTTLLALSLLLTLLPVTARALDSSPGGGIMPLAGELFSYGDSGLWYRHLGNGIEIADCDWTSSVIIPKKIEGKPVTSIGYYAFGECYFLTSISIPDSVTSIGDQAFYLCRNLTSISIPNKVTSIGTCAFSGCSSLTNISIPNLYWGDGVC